MNTLGALERAGDKLEGPVLPCEPYAPGLLPLTGMLPSSPEFIAIHPSKATPFLLVASPSWSGDSLCSDSEDTGR